MSAHVFLVAAEPSGDALGADLADALRAAHPAVTLSGIGGEQMRARGLVSDVDMSGLAVIGLIEGLKAFGRVRAAVEQAADVIARADPDSVVLIDSWGFMWRLARALKQRGVRARRIKLIGPQVWATRPGRARVLARWVDHLLCIHAFEQPFYERWGLPTTVIGNPALHRLEAGDGDAFRSRSGIDPHARVLGLLPGSRSAEVRRVMPALAKAAGLATGGRNDREVVCVVAPSVAAAVKAAARGWTFPHRLVVEETDKADAFAAMDVALACSGTVTTELAAQDVAVVTGYRVGWITWAIARLFLMRTRFITLLNVAAGREIVPEFVQTRFTVARLTAAAKRLLDDDAARDAQQQAQRRALEDMIGPGRPAADIAAETVLRLAAEKERRP